MSTKITDFGSKIGGARKDLKGDFQLEDLRDLTDLERVKYVTREMVWPTPDYAALADQGYDQKTLIAIKCLRDSLPKAPARSSSTTEAQFAQRCEQFVQFVNAVREIEQVRTMEDFARRLQGDPPTKLNDAIGVVVKNSRYVWSSGKRPALCESVFTDGTYVRDYDFRCALIGLAAGSLPRAARLLLRRNPDWPRATSAADTYLRKLGLSVIPVTAGGQWRIAVNGAALDSREAAFYRANSKKFNALCAELEAHRFASSEEGMSILRKVATTMLAAKKQERKPSMSERQKLAIESVYGVKATRQGPAWRCAHATPEQYMSEFGLRGGEFGNWVNQEERQMLLNNGYDAFCDMADILGWPRQGLSLGGSLAIAFGSRGGAGLESAHYEPERKVFNLTKPNGAGAMMHEWAHALDHHFGDRAKALGLVAPTHELYLSKMRLEAAKAGEGSEALALREMAGAMAGLHTHTYREQLTAEQQEQERSSMLDQLRRYLGTAIVHPKYTAAYRTSAENLVRDPTPEAFARHLQLTREATRSDCAAIASWGETLIRRLQEPPPTEVQRAISTEYLKASTKADQDAGKRERYFSARHEMFARALHAAVYDEIKDRGQRSPYLSYPAINLPLLEINYYPEGEERSRFRSALIGAMKALRPIQQQSVMELSIEEEGLAMQRMSA